jgi:hypothetical protein
MDQVPSLLQPLTAGASGVARKAVLAQPAQDATEEHFPLLVYEGLIMDDFTLTTRFKTVSCRSNPARERIPSAMVMILCRAH